MEWVLASYEFHSEFHINSDRFVVYRSRSEAEIRAEWKHYFPDQPCPI